MDELEVFWIGYVWQGVAVEDSQGSTAALQQLLMGICPLGFSAPGKSEGRLGTALY